MGHPVTPHRHHPGVPVTEPLVVRISGDPPSEPIPDLPASGALPVTGIGRRISVPAEDTHGMPVVDAEDKPTARPNDPVQIKEPGIRYSINKGEQSPTVDQAERTILERQMRDYRGRREPERRRQVLLAPHDRISPDITAPHLHVGH